MSITNHQQIISILIVCLTIWTAGAAEIYVAPTGNDKNQGTENSPFATVNRALREARELRRLNQIHKDEDIRILLKGGTYYLSEPIFVRPEDSGTETSTTSIESMNEEAVILSGGMQLNSWSPSKSISTSNNNLIWELDVPQFAGNLLKFRQLWVNAKKATRAKSTSGSQLDRILSWDKNDGTCWISNEAAPSEFEPGMELFIQQWWAIANLRISGMERKQDSTKLIFEMPERRIQNEHPWPAPWISKKTGNSPFYITNGKQFLDDPGEWYFDKKLSKLFYHPRPGETLSANAVIPILDNLVLMNGTIDRPIHHLQFKNISFQHSNWTRPSDYGHVPLQAGMFLLDAYKLQVPGTPDKAGLENQAWIGRPSAAIEANFVHNTSFIGCSFLHLSSTGLDYHRGVKDNRIQGNLFKDIGGSGIVIGEFSEPAVETHLPFNPSDPRELSSGNLILDNLITQVSTEDWGTVGIAAGFVNDITIAHNEISEVSYTGISLGWGWTKTENAMRNNKILANKIHHYGKHLYDVAGIYTLSAQPNSRIEGNMVYDIYQNSYAHDPYHWFYLYTDEGSSYITVINNWVPAPKFLQNANGPGNTWANNNASSNESTKRGAGVRAPYSNMLDQIVTDKEWPLKEVPKYSAIELIGKDLNTKSIKDLVATKGFIHPEVYSWKNRVVVYGYLNYKDAFIKELHQLFPKSKIKSYDTPFYEYQKAEQCMDSAIIDSWDHIVLTANLVDDPIMQQEYMDYHATQYQKWPEVSEGFCNANFQQLQIFRNGRQLLLFISIPKGSDFEKLNPLTVKNNPKVEEWNSLMARYQTGIKGTNKGEVWVEFQKVE